MNGIAVWLKSLMIGERRKAVRYPSSNLIAHYWNGGNPEGHKIRDISSKGLYVVTDHCWSPGTLIMISLQRTDLSNNDPEASIVVNTRIAYRDDNGMGLEFMPFSQGSDPGYFPCGADRHSLNRFLQGCHRHRNNGGQALIEFALILPLMFLLIMNMINFGAFFFAWITVANAARTGADYVVLTGGESVYTGTHLTGTQITNVITDEVSSLPNRASIVANVCQNDDTSGSQVITTYAGTCSSLPNDPESSAYTLMTVDVTYTYRPLIPAGFQFPNLHVYLTIPSMTVHRRAVMRLLN